MQERDRATRRATGQTWIAGHGEKRTAQRRQTERQPNPAACHRRDRNREPDQLVIEIIRRNSSPDQTHGFAQRRPGARSMPVQERAEPAEEHDQEQETAANNQRQEDGQERFAGGRRMRAAQADAIEHDVIDEGNETAADRHHGKQVGGAAGETDHAKRRLKGTVRAADEHQAQMQNPAADKQTNDHEQRRQHRVNDQKCPVTNAERTKQIVTPSETGDRLQKALKQNRNNGTGAAANQAEEQRIHQPALGPHHGEGYARLRNQEAHSVEPRFDKTDLLAVFPRQTGGGSGRTGHGEWSHGWRRCGRGADEFAQRPPFGHS